MKIHTVALVIGIMILGAAILLAALNVSQTTDLPTTLIGFFAALGTGIIKYAYGKYKT